jgi:hypothetical protein
MTGGVEGAGLDCVTSMYITLKEFVPQVKEVLNKDLPTGPTEIKTGHNPHLAVRQRDGGFGQASHTVGSNTGKPFKKTAKITYNFIVL